MIQTKTKKIYKAKVIRIEKVSASAYFIEIDCGMPVNVRAGQFVSVYCEGLTLRRPFSVFSNDNGKIGILFKERGEGTRYIKSLKVGEIIDTAGVFGNGFEIKDKKSLLVGAGIGIAPVSFLKTKLEERGIENILISGFLNKFEIPQNITNIDKIYTDTISCEGQKGNCIALENIISAPLGGEVPEGQRGVNKGSVLDYLEQVLEEYNPEIIYVCGPYVVLKKVAQTGIKYGIETQVAMEKVMACSIGVCRGCVIDIIKNGKVQNASVCKDGPVFRGDEVVWQL